MLETCLWLVFEKGRRLMDKLLWGSRMRRRLPSQGMGNQIKVLLGLRVTLFEKLPLGSGVLFQTPFLSFAGCSASGYLPTSLAWHPQQSEVFVFGKAAWPTIAWEGGGWERKRANSVMHKAPAAQSSAHMGTRWIMLMEGWGDRRIPKWF